MPPLRNHRESQPFSFPAYDMKSMGSRPLPALDAGEVLAMAASPEADPEMLLTIWIKSTCPRVKHALARNPATPVDALLRLWKTDPGAILENPVILVWEFAKPGSPRKILPASLQFSLYQFLLDRPEFDQHHNFISEDEVVRFLGKNGGARLKVPAHLVVRDERPAVRCALLEHAVRHLCENSGRPLGFPLEAIDALAGDSSQSVRHALLIAIAKDWIRPEPLDADHVVWLVSEMRARGGASFPRPIAQWPCLVSEMIERLSLGADEEWLAALARHPKASPGFHARMAANDSAAVRASVAASTRDEALLRGFFIDKNPLVRCGLASSPHLPRDLQMPLLESKDSRILLALLKNPATTSEILERLAGLPNLGIERLLRNHPNTPARILARLPQPYPDFSDHAADQP